MLWKVLTALAFLSASVQSFAEAPQLTEAQYAKVKQIAENATILKCGAFYEYDFVYALMFAGMNDKKEEKTPEEKQREELIGKQIISFLDSGRLTLREEVQTSKVRPSRGIARNCLIVAQATLEAYSIQVVVLLSMMEAILGATKGLAEKMDQIGKDLEKSLNEIMKQVPEQQQP